MSLVAELIEPALTVVTEMKVESRSHCCFRLDLDWAIDSSLAAVSIELVPEEESHLLSKLNCCCGVS